MKYLLLGNRVILPKLNKYLVSGISDQNHFVAFYSSLGQYEKSKMSQSQFIWFRSYTGLKFNEIFPSFTKMLGWSFSEVCIFTAVTHI